MVNTPAVTVIGRKKNTMNGIALLWHLAGVNNLYDETKLRWLTTVSQVSNESLLIRSTRRLTSATYIVKVMNGIASIMKRFTRKSSLDPVQLPDHTRALSSSTVSTYA